MVQSRGGAVSEVRMDKFYSESPIRNASFPANSQNHREYNTKCRDKITALITGDIGARNEDGIEGKK